MKQCEQWKKNGTTSSKQTPNVKCESGIVEVKMKNKT